MGHSVIVMEEYDIDPYGDLIPIDAKSICQSVLDFCESEEVKLLSARSTSIRILRSKLMVSLFHLNLKPNVDCSNQPKYTFMSSEYPYDPVYAEPFPRRPTIEAIDEAIRFVDIIHPSGSTTADSLRAFISDTNQADKLTGRARLYRATGPPMSFRWIVQHPVDAYVTMRHRLKTIGESASFPEFADTVNRLIIKLVDLRSSDNQDDVFQREVSRAIERLEDVRSNSGRGTVTDAPFYAPYPYRRTVSAIEYAVSVFDMFERCRYQESNDWYEVEESWAFANRERKLLPLYHFNRYKYQQFGLLSNPNIVLFPISSEVSMEDLMRLRPVPIGIVGANTVTVRVDRHYNTPLDFWYHDVNHCRRMWGYDKRLMRERGLSSNEKLIEDMRRRQRFIEFVLNETDPKLVDDVKLVYDVQIRKLQRFLLFETFHETALSATKESLLNDIFRKPAIPQPFEVMKQDDDYQKELNRQFDGNLKSGADNNSLNLDKPTTIEYFFDRAPSFLSNVYNKLAWGFHGCVFEERKSQHKMHYRQPHYLAEAVLRLADVLGASNLLPTTEELISDIEDRSGQPELYNYFALDPKMDVTSKIRTRRPTRKPMTASDIIKGRNLKKLHPNMSGSDIAKLVPASDDHRRLVGWMKSELIRYEEQFDSWFQQKLERATQVHFQNKHDFGQKFVGPEKQKVLKALPSECELKDIDIGGTMFIDTWAVPFYNSATQTMEQARDGVRKSIDTFNCIDDDNLTLYDMSRLISIYARPEFDDIRRYKLQLFPTDDETRIYGSERNDAKMIGDNFPEEGFMITNSSLEMDDLSFSFGIRLHYLGLITHDQLATADNRLFVGPADFLEHDMSHGYFTIVLPPPGTDRDWMTTHEEYRRMQAQIYTDDERLLNSLVYFYFTHESGYKSMMSSNDLAYKKELDVILQRIHTHRDFDWIVDRLQSCDMNKTIQTSFNKVTSLLTSKIKGR